jgi:hypothetical protein
LAVLSGSFHAESSLINDISNIADSNRDAARRVSTHQAMNGNLFLIPNNIHSAISYVHTEEEVHNVVEITEYFVKSESNRA